MVATILVADDHPLLLHGLTSLIARDPGFRIVGSAQNGTAAMAMIRQEKPDVAVLDLSMPGMSGLEVAAEIGRQGLATLCVLLTVGASQAQLYDAVAAGVAGIVLKEAAIDALLRCLHRVAAGGRWLPAELVGEAMQSEAARRTKWHDLSSRLTSRELEIARLVVTDRPNGQIAFDIGISKGTLKIHMNNIYRKLQVSSRAQLLQLAAGQIGPEARSGRTAKADSAAGPRLLSRPAK
ncbi:MAG: response regulator [Mesorhizobium sp.]|uniref:response regulator n=2 Tax=Mesorhizobium TaxID=68287 RepID=UPI000F74CA8E|nr:MULTISPECIES: response regulator transcription factor [unclassified Mesorhizobium]RVD70423.1 response regulator [Mesorhizobium sp. M4A.F.Ca.ET.029.04.2.1]AZO47944.1 response regulator transcription factor [Mesorhizobium sp. M4B.F.Ca.ET.058.02.1.1]RUX45733.1 response regulator [Mesorhizobium sp. M4A.F.Ca.ET.050.02.1.1]RVC41434.1 response regulator [Mesorhizobium sp. M4A.F.Ca.ET.090.04.2.1]RVC77388.1 response regulator [Mesorhizobium sp. M4A.F.Ca.ET.022.05.2.1]